MSVYMNDTRVLSHSNFVYDGVYLDKVYANGILVWQKVDISGGFSKPSISNWSFSYSTCADQASAGTKTYTDLDKIRFDFYDDLPEREIPIDQYPKLAISNSGLLWQSSTTNDANNICVTQFIFSFLGYTYKVVNETKSKYVKRKPYGSSDTYYQTITAGAQQYNGYTFLTINVNWTTQVYLGSSGYLDLSKMIGYCSYNAAGYVIEPEYAYARNYHYAGCTSGYCYPLSFTKV